MKITTGNACVAAKIPSQTLSHIVATEPTVKTYPLVVLVLEPDWTGQGVLCLDPGPAKLQNKTKKNQTPNVIRKQVFPSPCDSRWALGGLCETSSLGYPDSSKLPAPRPDAVSGSHFGRIKEASCLHVLHSWEIRQPHGP